MRTLTGRERQRRFHHKRDCAQHHLDVDGQAQQEEEAEPRPARRQLGDSTNRAQLKAGPPPRLDDYPPNADARKFATGHAAPSDNNGQL